MVEGKPVIELKKRLEDYGFELITAERAEESLAIEAVEPAEETGEDAQLSFELDRPSPRLRVVRRHPSI